ncbi:MAG: hypothetical protein CL846_06460 [Crocinitomicaceae bacterium]|nr:hypothetical protein [Crocinitomicaceae bacterium]
MRNCKNPLLKLVFYFVLGLTLAIYFSLNSWIYSMLLIASILSLIFLEYYTNYNFYLINTINTI